MPGGDGASGKPTRRRGRPRSIDRAAAIDRAVEAFWRAGYEGTSLDDLTAAMDVARPTLYEAFGGKRTLFLTALDAYSQRIGGAAIAAFQAERSPRDAARAFLTTLLSFQAPDDGRPTGCLIACVAATSAGQLEGVQERLQTIHAGSLAAVEAGFHALSSRENAIADHQTSLASARALRLLDAMNAQAVRARAGATRADLLAEMEDRLDGIMG